MAIKGQHWSPETEIKKGQHLSPKTEIERGQHLSPETEIKRNQHLSPNTEFKKGWHPTAGFKKGHIPFNKGKIMPADVRRKLSASKKGKHSSPATELTKAKWRIPEFAAKMMLAANKKPTKPEKQLEAILNKHLPEFKYNSDGRLGVTLGGLTPDFINVNGKKDLIEVFGDYYHSPEVLGDRWQGSELGKVMIYNSLGWRCLVIWEHELKELTEGQVVDKIKAFFKRRRFKIDKTKKLT